MKVIFILFLCFLVNLVSAQDFQYRIDSNVNTVKIDSIGKIVRELRNYNTKGNNRYLSYWEAYAYYKCAILSRVLKKEEDAEKFTEKFCPCGRVADANISGQRRIRTSSAVPAKWNPVQIRIGSEL